MDNFDVLRTRMIPMGENELVYKIIETQGLGECPTDMNSVSIFYNGYTKGEKEPFTGKITLDPTTVTVGDGSLPLGLEMAIKSMKAGEKSHFLIHHSLMYGDSGCPPYVPSKAECLFNIKLVSINDESVQSLRYISWESITRKIKEGIEKGKFLIKLNKFYEASKVFSKLVKMLTDHKLNNFTQQKEHTQLLCCIYVKLAKCYHVLNLPNKVLVIYHEYANLSKVNYNINMSILRAKAFFKLGDLDRAEHMFLKAGKIEENNKEVANGLKLIKEKRKMRNQKRIFEFNKDTIAKKEVNCKIQDLNDHPDCLENELTIKIRYICESMRKNSALKRSYYELPHELSDFEIESIKQVILSYKLLIQETDNSKYIYILKE